LGGDLIQNKNVGSPCSKIINNLKTAKAEHEAKDKPHITTWLYSQPWQRAVWVLTVKEEFLEESAFELV
jgi:hypothetical protein